MMRDSNMDTTNSGFKRPKTPLAPSQFSQAESLLFNDILDDKVVALRNVMVEFLQVQPFRKFESEFSNFMKRVKRGIDEGHRTGSNVSRLTNVSQICGPGISRPSASFNYRPMATMSMISSNSHSTYRLSENNFLPVDSLNPFKPPLYNLQPKVVLPRIDQSVYNVSQTSNLSTTVIKVNGVNKEISTTNNDYEIGQSSNYIERPNSTEPVAYSNVTIIENGSASNSQQNNELNDEQSSIESLLDGVGFKIVVGLPDGSHVSKKSNNTVQLHQTQAETTEIVEKYLSMWSVNVKEIKSKVKVSMVVLLTGTLLGEDRVTAIEKYHNAGILESRKTNDLVKTKNGTYRLIGNIIGGSPNELYRFCLDIGGIPRNWRRYLKQFSVDKTKKKMLNFSLESPAGPPIKSVKPASNINMSITRRGTVYNENRTRSPLKKRKFSDNNTTENKRHKQQKYQQLSASPLIASTPKRPKQSMFETPSQVLKNKLHQHLIDKPRNKSNSRTLASINDSISITKKRRSYSKEPINQFLKPKSVQTSSASLSSSSTKVTKSTTVGSSFKDSTIKSAKQVLKNNSSVNSSHKQSESQRSKTSSTTSSNLNSSKQHSRTKSSMNSTKSKLNCTIKSPTPEKPSAVKKVKTVKQKENIMTPNNNRSCLSENSPVKNITNIKSKKAIKQNTNYNCKKLNNANPKKKVSKKNDNKIKNKEVFPSKNSSGEHGLFDDIEVEEYGDMSDYNIMQSPGKISMVSGGDKSRSVTPPLFNQHWLSSASKSVATSEPPTPLSKSVEAKALKRVKAPKITLEEELKNIKTKNKNRSIDYNSVSNKINQMLEFGEQFDEED